MSQNERHETALPAAGLLGGLPLSVLATQKMPSDADSSLMKTFQRSKQYVPIALYVLRDDEWVLETDETTISQKSYLYVSYYRSQFDPNERDQIEDAAQDVCTANGLDACWIDYVCMGEGNSGNLEALYRMGDVIRNAAITLILIGPGNDNPRSSMWLQWGSRIWTLPELLFSRKLMLRVGSGIPISIDSRRLGKMLYDWENSDIGSKLLYAFSSNARLEVTRKEIIEALIYVLWADRPCETLTSLHVERVTALSAFLPHQIGHTSDPVKAFKELMERNMLTGHNFAYPSKFTSIEILKALLSKITVPTEFFYDPPNNLYPTALMVRSQFSGNWVIRAEQKVIGHNYVALSYRQDRIQYEDLRTMAETLSWHALELNAYWIDAYCMLSGYAAAQDLYHLGDAFLRAKVTLIVLPHSTAELGWSESELWHEWGRSIWSIVELLLSSDIKYIVGNGHMNNITRRQICVSAYGEKSGEMALVDLVERSSDKDSSSQVKLAYLIDAIWRKSVRITGKLRLSRTGEEEPPVMPGFEAERVYALMMFMPVRIFPRENESENDALDRLLRVNGEDGVSFRKWLRGWCQSKIPNATHLSSLLGSENVKREHKIPPPTHHGKISVTK